MDAFNQAYEGITGLHSFKNANSSSDCQMLGDKGSRKDRRQDMNLLCKISTLLNKNCSDIKSYPDEDLFDNHEATDASDTEISGEQSFLHASGCEEKMDDMDANILIFNADTEGRVKLSDEEKETFVSEGLPIPNRIPLTKAEERALKRIRRKIKNKLSAQESRRKKKEYVEGLEKRVEACNSENSILQQKVDSLETTVRALLTELNRLRKVALEKESRKRTLKAKSIGTQTGTCLKCHLKKEALGREKNFTAERQKTFRDNAKPYMERFNGLRIKSRD